MQKNTQAAKEAHTELRNCKQEIKEIKKFNDFRSMMNKMSNKRGEKYTCLLTELNLHNKGVQENNKLFFFLNTSEQHKETQHKELDLFLRPASSDHACRQ